MARVKSIRTNPANHAPEGDERLKSAIHWALIRARWDKLEAERNEDGYTEQQALHCPHYVPLEGEWGADWGAIMHPQSVKFGHLVFEHEWCGCGRHGPEGNQSAATQGGKP